MSQTIARLTSPAQLVAALPHWLGFQPAESLVVLCLHEPRGRLGLTMRYDLPARQHEPELVAEVLVRVRHERATRVALVVLTEDPAPRVRGDLVDALVAGIAPLPVTDGVLVRGARFWSYLCTQERCCPAAGTPVRSGAMTRSVQLLAAETVLSGRPVLPSRREIEALLAPPSFLASSAAAQRLEDAGAELGCALLEQGLEPFRRRCVDRWRAVLDRWSVPPARLDDQEAAQLVVALDDVIVRDQVAAWSAGQERAAPGPAAGALPAHTTAVRRPCLHPVRLGHLRGRGRGDDDHRAGPRPVLRTRVPPRCPARRGAAAAGATRPDPQGHAEQSRGLSRPTAGGSPSRQR